jgi:sugar phosphate isomerase/epimerase
MQPTRRQFIKSGLASTAGMTLAPVLTMANDTVSKIPVAFQLFTVRAEFARNVPETLKTLGQIGYKAVEFWDYAGTANVYQNYTARDLRKMLDGNSLKCCGMHVKLEALSDDNLKRTIENNQTLGSTYINVAMAQEKMKSAGGIAELATLLNEVSDQCARQEILVGYHSHGFDFGRINGRFAWEILFSQTRPEVNMQLDVGNCLGGGGDPIAMLKEFPGRTRTIHIKEYQDKTFDTDFYKEVFRLCETTSGTKWYIVEMGSNGGSGFDVPREALAKLHTLGK